MAGYAIELHTTSHRGDHAADVVIALDGPSHLTVADLADAQLNADEDYLVIRRRRLLKTDGKTPPEGWPF